MHKVFSKLKNNYLLWLTFFCLGLGIFFPGNFSFLGNYINWFLAFIFFLSAFTIDLKAVQSEAKKVFKISWFITLSLILLPILIFYIILIIDQQSLVAFVLLSAMPPGLTSPTIAGILGGKKSLALVLTIVSSFLAPFLVSIILSITIKEQISFNFWEMASQIALLTILPFIIGSLFKKAIPKISGLVKPVTSSLSVILLGLIILGVIAKTTQEYGQDIFLSFENLIILGKISLLFLFLHLIGWFIFSRNDRAHRISFMVCLSYVNFTLALTLAERFFPAPEVIIPLVLSIIPWSIGISIAKQKLAK